MSIGFNIVTMRMLRALDNPLRIKIVQYIINSSSAPFTKIHEHLKKETGKEIKKGTLSYHLDILVQSNTLNKELERGSGRTYSKYNISEQAERLLKALGLLVEINESE